MPLDPKADCRRCWANRPRLSGVRSAFVYDGTARDVVLALKFRGLSAVTPVIARWMGDVLNDWAPPVASIVPVPLTGRRKRLRGFNQSEVIAKEVARLTSLPISQAALKRHFQTTSQARSSGDARWQNVVDAFRPGDQIPTGGVLVIDDVITTGATLNACARVLLNEGAGPVFALTFARED
jgi:ComF family protein